MTSVAILAAALALHAQLEESSPADGEILSEPPSSVTLVFSGLVEETGAAMVLLGPDGASWDLDPVRPPDDPRILSGVVPALPSGAFRLEWRVISLDGHPVSGDVVFFVGQPGEVEAPFRAPPATQPDGGAAAGMDMGSAGAAHTMPPLGMAVRATVDVTLLGLAGLLLFAGLGAEAVSDRTRRTAAALAGAGAVAASAYGWMWAGEVLGPGAGLGDRATGLVDLVSGRPLGAEILLAWLALWALLVARRPSLAALFAFAGVATGGFGGHPASYQPIVSVPANGLHLVAAAVWLGGLLVLVTEAGSTAFRPLARRVSRFALMAAVVIAVSGLLQTWVFFDSPRQLWSTSYGLLVLAKIAGFLTLIGFGAFHRFRLMPAIEAEEGKGARAQAVLARSVRLELTVAAAVVLVAAIVAHIPPNP